MELTDKVLEEVRHYAGLFYTPKQVAIICDIPLAVMRSQMQVESTPLYLAYWKGYYEAEIEYRTEVKKSSNFGSSPAQTLLGKILEQHKMDMVHE